MTPSLLIEQRSGRDSVDRVVALIVVMAVLGPILAAAVGLAGAGEVAASVLGTSSPALALIWLAGAALRDRQHLKAQLGARDSQMLTILDGLPIAVMLRADDGTLLHINPGAERFLERLGVDASHVRSSPSSLLDHVNVVDEDGRRYEAAALPVVSAIREVSSRDATLGYGLPGGGYAWYAIRAAPVPLSDGTIGTVVTCDDVTERHEARQRAELAERSLRRTFDHAPIGIAVFAPTGELLEVNSALCELLGYDEDHLLAAGLCGAGHPGERDDHLGQLAEWLSGAEERYLVDRRFTHASGRQVFTQMSVAILRTDDGEPLRLIAQIVDLSDRLALEQELRLAASKDPLTGLPNRRALLEQLAVAQHRQARSGGEIGLLYLDLDRFKDVNDTYGHDVGDRVLIETGRRLVAATRQVDTVCRIGGDEFVILCAPIHAAHELRDLVNRIASMPPVTILVGGLPLAVAVAGSIGSITVDPNEDINSALARADAAMYRAKRRQSAAQPGVLAGP